MVREKVEELLTAVNSELEKAKSDADKTFQSAVEIAATSRTSWSQAGDREHSRGQDEITEDRYQKLQELKEEIEKSLSTEFNEIVQPVSYVVIEWIDKEKNDFYLVTTPTVVAGKLLVSTKSKLGSVLIGKKKYQDFELKADENLPAKKGRILDIQ